MDKLNEVVGNHYPQWQKYARGLVSNRSDAEDLLSEVLLEVLSNRRHTAERLAEEGKLFWYINRALYLAARNTTSRYGIQYRKWASAWAEGDTQYMAELDEPWLGARLDNEYLDAYIATMPQLDAVILRLYALEGFKYEEVSMATGIPKRELYKLVEKAISKIKRNVKLYRPKK